LDVVVVVFSLGFEEYFKLKEPLKDSNRKKLP